MLKRRFFLGAVPGILIGWTHFSIFAIPHASFKLVDAAGEKHLQRHQYLPTLMPAINY
jgi:hypothetical protein